MVFFGDFVTRSVSALCARVSVLEHDLKNAVEYYVDGESGLLSRLTTVVDRARQSSAFVEASDGARSALQQEVTKVKKYLDVVSRLSLSILRQSWCPLSKTLLLPAPWSKSCVWRCRLAINRMPLSCSGLRRSILVQLTSICRPTRSIAVISSLWTRELKRSSPNLLLQPIPVSKLENRPENSVFG